ncbi:MAG: hypothetical protein U1E20_06250 [Methylocystis sp.]|uniref:hypothetical protein n=1 Tax=Methylocystis sp. TaxID=1911079 RepID=UPI003930CA35
MILASIAAPLGILSAIDKRAAQRNETRARLLSRAGITQNDWDDLSAALGSANAENLRKALNASHAALVVIEQSTPIPDGSAASHNGPITSHFGDLS